MSTGGGGSKPKEVKASEAEKQQASLARDQIDYYRGTFAPLEGRFAELSDQDPSSRLQGQNGAASSREMTGTLQQAALNGGVVNTAEIAEGQTLGRVGGMIQGARELGDNRLEALGVGLGISADATRSLSTAASAQTDEAVRQTQLSMATQKAKNDERNALFGAAGSLGGMYAGYKLPGALKKDPAAGMSLADAGKAYESTSRASTTFAQRNKLING